MVSFRSVLGCVVVVMCVLFAGSVQAQCPGGQCGPVQSAAKVVLDTAQRVVRPVKSVVVRRAEAPSATRRGVFCRIFRRR